MVCRPTRDPNWIVPLRLGIGVACYRVDFLDGYKRENGGAGRGPFKVAVTTLRHAYNLISNKS
jgi:hypothetical protein